MPTFSALSEVASMSELPHDPSTSTMEDVQVPKVKGFLDLPGEIRNRTYEYCARYDDVVDIRPKACEIGENTRYLAQELFAPRESKKKRMPDEYFDSTMADWMRATRQHYKEQELELKQAVQLRGLTQTCRQIRTEFWPIYMRQTAFGICWCHVAQYVDTFLVDLGDDPQSLVTKLVLTQDCDHKSKVPVDILPALRLHSSIPGFRLEFVLHGEEHDAEEEATEQDGDFRELLSTKGGWAPPDDNNETWLKCMWNNLHALYLEPGLEGQPKFTFFVNAECAEDWMSDGHRWGHMDEDWFSPDRRKTIKLDEKAARLEGILGIVIEVHEYRVMVHGWAEHEAVLA